jgi:hypothetical protein
MEQDNFLLLIFTLILFWMIGIVIFVFCVRRVLLHQNELRNKKLSEENRLLEKTKLNIMLINTIVSIVWVIFFSIRSVLTVFQYLK